MGSIKKRKRKPPKKKNVGGRPRADISLKELEKLCELQCTHEEIAAFFRVSIPTIERLAAKPEVAEIIERGKNRGKISVRRQQLNLLKKGNATMAVWLGKQLLGQRDKIDNTLRTPPEDPFRIVTDKQQAMLLTELFGPEEIAAAHKKMLDREIKAAQTA